MKRKSLIIILTVILSLFCVPGAYALDVQIDGNSVQFDTNYGIPFIDANSRTMVPVRATMEKAGATVSWDNDTAIVTVVKNDITVQVPIGQNYILKNGIRVENDTAATVVDSRTYLPIRAVLEAFGYSVSWDVANQTVAAKNIDTRTYVQSEPFSDYVYTGAWLNGKPNGQGTAQLSYGGIYVGNFINGDRTGKGTYTWPSGDVYIGDFTNGVLHGKGTYTWSSGDIYIGDWSNGARTGKGTFTWLSGDVYVGDFLNSSMTGQGVYTFADGAKLTGKFADGASDGTMTYMKPDGTKLVGQLVNGVMEGNTLYTDKNGNTHSQLWRNGSIVSTTPLNSTTTSTTPTPSTSNSYIPVQRIPTPGEIDEIIAIYYQSWLDTQYQLIDAAAEREIETWRADTARRGLFDSPLREAHEEEILQAAEQRKKVLYEELRVKVYESFK